MVVKIFISGISGNKEVKKRQQRVLMILESKGITCEVVDITEPGKEADKEFMQKNSKLRDEQRHPLPPQIFNEEEYCGDYDDFDLSNEIDELEKFLKVPRVERDLNKRSPSLGNGTTNGLSESRETSAERVIEVPPVQESIEESNKTAEEPAAQDQTSADAEGDEEEEEEEDDEQE